MDTETSETVALIVTGLIEKSFPYADEVSASIEIELTPIILYLLHFFSHFHICTNGTSSELLLFCENCQTLPLSASFLSSSVRGFFSLGL